MDEALATGKVESTSARPGWRPRRSGGIPAYMKEKCPGLPNWEALKDPACAEAFSTAETAPKGRYLGGPVTWGGFDEERVEALDLPFEVVHAGTDAALFAELESAYQRKAPIMLLDLRAALGADQVQGRVGGVPAHTRTPATRTRPGASIRTPPTTAASRTARSGRSAGPAARRSGRRAYDGDQASSSIDNRRDGRR